MSAKEKARASLLRPSLQKYQRLSTIAKIQYAQDPTPGRQVNADRATHATSSVQNGLEMYLQCDRVVSIDSGRSRVQGRLMPKQISLRLPTELWTRAERELDAIKNQPEYQGVPLSTSRVLIMAIARGLPQLETKEAP